MSKNRGNKIIRVYRNRIEITSPAKGEFGEALALEILKKENIPPEGIEIEAYSVRKIKKVTQKKAKTAKETTKQSKKKEVKEPKKTGRKETAERKPEIITINDATLVGTAKLPGKPEQEIYVKGRRLYVRKGTSPVLMPILSKITYGKHLKTIRQLINLPADLEIIENALVKEGVKQRHINQFLLIAQAKSDLVVVQEGEKYIVKEIVKGDEEKQ